MSEKTPEQLAAEQAAAAAEKPKGGKGGEKPSAPATVRARVLVDCVIDGQPAKANSVVTIARGTYADVTDPSPAAVAYADSLRQ